MCMIERKTQKIPFPRKKTEIVAFSGEKDTFEKRLHFLRVLQSVDFSLF